MKFVIATCVLFFVVMTSVMASEPSQDAFEHLPATFDEPIYEPAIVQRGDRHRRVTCDLLSFNTKWGSINHAACAAHCLAMRKGYRGGHCDGNGVCVCRK